MVNGDGCSTTCQLDGIVTVAPRAITTPLDNQLWCNLAASNTGRKAPVDQLGRFYVAMLCANEVYVAVSDDGGLTWSPPQATGILHATEVALEGGAGGIAYLAAIQAGELVLSGTTDGGHSWTPARSLDTFVVDSEVSMDAHQGTLYIAVSAPGSLRVLTGRDGVDGPFGITDVIQENAFHDIVVDKITGLVLLVSETPLFHVRVSTDGGVTFGPEYNPPGMAVVSDWAGSNGVLLGVGTVAGGNVVHVISAHLPGFSTTVGNLPEMMMNPGGRAIDADANGNAYVVSALDDGSIQLDRLVYNASAVDADDARLLGTGGSPAIVALPSNNGALVAYEHMGAIYAAVVAY